ncbi:cyclophilin-like fold protein [Streptomyces sp. NPDC014684]|uniref:cyclophilin-like fold protein n=1 Tax=Streptomyces sp. NPDC014684 TaxID=3364880 RepID=UPI0036FD1545
MPHAPFRLRHAAVPAAAAATILTAAGCTTTDPQTGAPATTAQSQQAGTTTAQESTTTMDIQLTTDSGTYHATLNDSATARDFAALLPLTLTLNDYAGTEKISGLPKKLSTAGSPSGTAAKAGDVTLYAPWGNLAIFYEDFPHSEGLVKIGEFTDNIDDFARRNGNFKVTITAAD